MASTSLMPHLVFRVPTMMPQRAPAAMAARKHSGIRAGLGRSFSRMPVTAAAMEPTTNWPSAPMLNTPVLNENATDRPVRMYGVAYTITYEMPFTVVTLSSSLPYASPTETPMTARNSAPTAKPRMMASRIWMNRTEEMISMTLLFFFMLFHLLPSSGPASFHRLPCRARGSRSGRRR